MTREEAIKNIKKALPLSDVLTESFYTLHPELRESEDERIRKGLIKLLTVAGEAYLVSSTGIKKDSYLAYLEKQKENPKSDDSILSDCASDAKCGDRWQKVTDSLPDNPREVLCKDEAGNYFIGRYYVGEGWEISNYDDEDKPHHLNPPVSKWIDFPSEKQKDASKAIEAVERIDKYIDAHLANAHDMQDSNPDKKYYRGWDDALGKMAGILQDVYSEKENKFTPRVLPCSASWFEDGDEKQKEQKQERKVIIPKFRVGDIVKRIPFEKWDSTKRIDSIDEHGYNFDYKHLGKSGGGCIGFSFEEDYELVEQKPAEWKPTEEQMEALNYAIAEWDGGKKLEGLYALRTDLKKLM